MLKAKKSFSFSLSSLKDPRVLSGLVLLLILGLLPILLFEVKQQQQQPHAAAGQFRPDICGVHFAAQDLSPASCHLLTGAACNIINTTPNATNGHYAARVAMTSNDGKTHTVKFEYWRFFCSNGGLNPATCSCADVPAPDNGASQTFTVNPGSSTNFDLAWDNPSQFAGQSCGQFQFDYIINNIDGNVNCSSGLSFGDPAAFEVCQTGVNCSTVAPSPSPTLTPSPTLIPSPTLTPSPTISPTATLTPPVTITQSVTPSVTPTSTITNTPTPTPTGTITPQPTNTPTSPPTGNPTSTPTPPIVVVRPTLPPTGPNNTFVTVGLVGVAISVLGMAVLLGL